MKKLVLLIPFMLCSLVNALSQNYHAIKGSSYAGILGVANNPASIVNTAYSWDVNIMSVQETTSTNTLTIYNYSLLSSVFKSKYRINEGEFERYAKGNFNIHLLNARVALNRKNSIAFGINLRGYSSLKTSRYSYIDTVNNIRDFGKINENNTNFHGDVKSSNWMEIFATYGKTLWDEQQSRLNAGITVKATRGIAGAFAGLKGTVFTRAIENNRPVYFVKAANAKYGYSSNIDGLKNSKSASQNFRDLIVNTRGGVSVDLGLEYIIKPQAVSNYYDDDNYFDYEWKVSVSLLDFGTSKYEYSAQSRAAEESKANISDDALQQKLSNVSSVEAFNDSLATVFPDLRAVSGTFSIINPARLVINVDRHLFEDFYLNGEITGNLSSLAGPDRLYSTEMNFITLTPRWETRSLGVYLPVQFNTEHQFWVGGAVKAGPLLFGVHNLSNIFAKSKMQNGGGYLAFVIRPGNRTRAYRDKRYDCPR